MLRVHVTVQQAIVKGFNSDVWEAIDKSPGGPGRSTYK